MKKGLVLWIIAAIVIVSGVLVMSKIPQNIELEEFGKKVIIDKPRRSINLLVTGVDSEFGVTKDTEIVKLTLAGIKNTVFLCNGIHNPEVEDAGMQTSVVYMSCD